MRRWHHVDCDSADLELATPGAPTVDLLSRLEVKCFRSSEWRGTYHSATLAMVSRADSEDFSCS